MAVPDAVRRLAVHSALELPVAPAFERIERNGVVTIVTPYPSPFIVHPVDLATKDVPAAVDAMRAIGRARGKSALGWWIAPEDDRYVPYLEALGLVNEDKGGYEAVENAMALVSPPPASTADGIEVKQVESFEEFAGAARASMEAFALTPSVCAQLEAGLAERFAEYEDPSSTAVDFVAVLDGRIVGSGGVLAADAGVNLFGGCVVPSVRGRGVYRALLGARWDYAVERGTPALTVQAGRMSKPILERLGFVQLAACRLFFDEL